MAFLQQGSFLFKNEGYEIEPYHAKVHKRSLGAKEGDHVVRKRSTDSLQYQSDYLGECKLKANDLWHAVTYYIA